MTTTRKKNTRAAQGSGTIRQRKDGTWEARYTVGRDPGTGKQIQRSVYGRTQAEVRKKLTAKVQEVDMGIFSAPNKLTVGAWLDEWATNYLGGVKPSTVDQYCYQIRVHLRPTLGSVKLEALSAPMIQKVYNEKLREGLSAKSIRNVNGVLHAAMKQALKMGLIRVNPCDSVVLPRVEKKEIHPLDESQISTFLQTIKGHRFEALFVITLFTGLREGEVLGLTWDAVDMDKGMLVVNKQLQKARGKGGAYSLVPTKNSKSRCITLAPFVLTLIKDIRRQQLEWRMKHGQGWANPTNLVFTDEIGGHLMPHTVYHRFKDVVTAMGCPTVRFHDLRHTFATLSLQNGDDVKTVQENLGHATPSFTLSVYAHATERMKQASANRMEAFIQSCKG